MGHVTFVTLCALDARIDSVSGFTFAWNIRSISAASYPHYLTDTPMQALGCLSTLNSHISLQHIFQLDFRHAFQHHAFSKRPKEVHVEKEQKVRENKLRRMARRREMWIEKSRRRDQHASDYGKYCVFDYRNGLVYSGNTLDGVEWYLTEGYKAPRKALPEGTFVGKQNEVPASVRAWVDSLRKAGGHK